MDIKSPMMRWNQPGGGFSIVQFERATVRNSAASAAEGRPIYDKILRVYITPPGQKNQVVTHELERVFYAPEGQQPRIRRHEVYWPVFQEHLRAWDDGSGASMTGTPLNELRALDMSIVASLREMGIHTVEHLAALPDAHLPMGGRTWRELAAGYLKQAEGQKPLAEMAARLARLEEDNAALKAQLAGQGIEPAEGKPRRGRPPRAENEAA